MQIRHSVGLTMSNTILLWGGGEGVVSFADTAKVIFPFWLRSRVPLCVNR